MCGGFQRLTIATALSIVSLGLAGATVVAAADYPDPAADVRGGGGPDLTAISVSHTRSTIAFRLRFAQAPPLRISLRERWVDMLVVLIDVPPRSMQPTPGGWIGADFYAGLHGSQKSALLVKAPSADPSQSKVLAHPKVTITGRLLAFSISRRALGNPAWFEFSVAAGRESAQPKRGGSDEAPNHGTFHYQLRK